jgi:hypothetical protein
MLHYEAIEQVCRDRMQQRRGEAESERLVLQSRGKRQGRRSPRTARLTLLLRAVRQASSI